MLRALARTKHESSCAQRSLLNEEGLPNLPGVCFKKKAHSFEVAEGLAYPTKVSKFLLIGAFYCVDFEYDLQKSRTRRHRRPRRRQRRHVVGGGAEMSGKSQINTLSSFWGVVTAQGSQFRVTSLKFCAEFESTPTLGLAPESGPAGMGPL